MQRLDQGRGRSRGRPQSELVAEPREGGGHRFPERLTNGDFDIGATRDGLRTAYDCPDDTLCTCPGRSEEKENEEEEIVTV